MLNNTATFRTSYRLGLVAALIFILIGCKEVEKNVVTDPVLDGSTLVFPNSYKGLSGLKTETVLSEAPRRALLSGRTIWDEGHTVRITPPFTGKIAAIHAETGARVNPGESLATLTSAEFGQVQSEARRAYADETLAQQNFERQQRLFEAGIIARKDLEQAKADAERTKAERERAASRLNTLEGQAQAVDQRWNLRSPIAGKIVEKHINQGQEVRPDDPQPLFVISAPETLWVQLEAPESLIPVIKEGMTVQILSEIYPEQRFPAVVQYVASGLDPETRTLKVRAVLDNKKGLFKSEMYVTAEVPMENMKDAVISNRSLFLYNNKHYVFVKKEDRYYERREVKPSGEFSGQTQILSGIKAGEQVVVEGNLFLQEMYLQAKASEAAAASTPKVSPPGVQGHGK